MHTSRQFTLKAIAKVQPELGLTNWQVKNCDRQRKETTKLQPRYTLKAIALLVGLLTALTFSQEVHAATFNVADGDVAGLIAAINSANASAGPTTINLAPNGTYTLTAVAEDDGYAGGAGLPYIRRPLTINGNGATIQRSSAAGTPDFRIVYVFLSDLTLNGVTIRGGRGGNVNRGGGGIGMIGSNLNVADSTITDNVGFGAGGGGIGSFASTFRIENSTISHNTSFSGYGGGGIINFSAGATSTITSSTIFDNQNDSGRGDAIADAFSGPGTMVVKNSVLASPTRGVSDDCYAAPGVVVSQGHNIAGDGTCSLTGPGDMNSTNPLLGPLANNGGNTPTHALLAGSPAIDAIPLADCTNTAGAPIIADQRGIFRPQGARCDIGAYEFSNSLVSRWQAEGNALDNAGTNNGTLVDGTTFTGGISGQAFSFDGIDDRVSVPNSLNLNVGTGDFTVSFFAKFNDLANNGNGLVHKDTYGNEGGYRGWLFNICDSCAGSPGIGIETRNLSQGIDNNARYPTSNFQVGTWYHIAAVRQSNVLYLYIDGVLRATVAESHPTNLSNGADLEFGSLSSGSRQNFDGALDEITFHNRALSASEIGELSNLDSSAPIITPTVTGTLGNDGWYTSEVEVSWSVTDPESGVSTSTGCDTTNVTTDTTGVTFTCTATSGGGSANQSVTIKRDATAPSVSCGSTDGAWHSLDVSITCTANDSASQLANAGDASFSLTTSVAAGTETANASTNSRTVFDNAGNSATAGPINGNKVDKKAPTITITNPTATNYLLNQPVAANFTCQDGGSGVATCNGSAANGNNIDTATVGSKSFTVSATDNVGNSPSPQSVAYAVGFGISVLYDQTKAAKSGSVIPIKLQLVDALGHNVSSAGLVVHAASLVQIATSASEVINDAGNANPDVNFRFDSSLGTGGGYIFNLKTTGLSTGTYKLGFIVGADPSIYWVQFAVRQ